MVVAAVAPPRSADRLLGGRRIDDAGDAGDAVRREAAAARVLTNRRLVGRVIDAVDLVGGNEALDPLDVAAGVIEVPNDAARLGGDRLEVGGAQLPRARDLALDDELRHGYLLTGQPALRDSGPLT